MILRYFESFRKLRFSRGLGPENSPHFNNVGVFKFGAWMKLPLVLEASPLNDNVSHVFGMISSPEMNWIAAGAASYARVKNIFSRWRVGFIVENPCDSMCMKASPRAGSSAKPNLAIPILLNVKLPRPAVVQTSNFHMGPEPTIKRLRDKLLDYFRRDSFRSHSVSCLIVCHAFGHANDARALPFYHAGIIFQP